MKAYLILENGRVFLGEALGRTGKTVGELVFTTNMVGYTETLTDPSYYGQIVMQTFPLVGNYGVMKADFESDKSYVFGYVVRECADKPSNFRTDETLGQFLTEQGKIGISGVDTREITKITRNYGVMNAMIISDGTDLSNEKTLESLLSEIRAFKIENAVRSVSKRQTVFYKAENERYKIALIDYGAKGRIIENLLSRGASVCVMPHTTFAKELLTGDFDGVMLSNGPGDPAENTFEIAQIAALFGKIPLFGICLGHQLLALASGGKTEKLKFGHRGGNQPVKDLKSGKVYITSQNHGYAVIADSLDKGFMSHQNVNDGSCEGAAYPDYSAFSVQFHPEAASGPLDTGFLFDDFLSLIGDSKCQK